MEEMEVIRIAHSRHRPKQAPLPEESRPYVGSFWDASQVGAVEASSDQETSRADDDWDDVSWVLVVAPIRGSQLVTP